MHFARRPRARAIDHPNSASLLAFFWLSFLFINSGRRYEELTHTGVIHPAFQMERYSGPHFIRGRAQSLWRSCFSAVTKFGRFKIFACYLLSFRQSALLAPSLLKFFLALTARCCRLSIAAETKARHDCLVVLRRRIAKTMEAILERAVFIPAYQRTLCLDAMTPLDGATSPFRISLFTSGQWHFLRSESLYALLYFGRGFHRDRTGVYLLAFATIYVFLLLQSTSSFCIAIDERTSISKHLRT
jgi:hypothetical protein